MGLVAVNYVVAKKDKSWDLTTKKIFTLAPQTTHHARLAQGEGAGLRLPRPERPGLRAGGRLLQRYRAEAPDKFEVVFKDPAEGAGPGAEVPAREGQTTLVLTRGEGTRRPTPRSR